jgi:hypothetical protein
MKEKEKTRSSTTEGVVTTTSRRQDHRLSCYTHTQTRSTVFRHVRHSSQRSCDESEKVILSDDLDSFLVRFLVDVHK